VAEFLTTQGTSYYIEHIITNAKNRLVLISPYIQLSRTLFERLRDADKRNVKITLVCRRGALKPDERSQLQQLKNLSLYFHENLHAKSYFNEECMVITSMNIYEASEKNREMGILIRKEDDNKIFSDGVREAKSIVDSSTKDDLRKQKEGSYSTRAKQTGYCIRCRIPIPYDLDRPYCRDCFSEWVVWENPDYEESYCHTCGKPTPTSMAKPECYSCYSE